jgi:nitronate monooxygenase
MRRLFILNRAEHLLQGQIMASETSFTKHAKVQYPIICGAMYPCSNPDLVAAVSEAGGLGIVQPVSLRFAHKYDMRKGLQYIKSKTSKPIGFNLLVEKSAKKYEERLKAWLDIALEEGVRFFVTALGNPQWVVDKVKPFGGVVYHDVVNGKWAEKALHHGVDGLICVNNLAGGHVGSESPEALIEQLRKYHVPLICAGGVGTEQEFLKMMKLGYEGVQMGTRFIATKECSAHDDYKQAILKAGASDIVWTERISGVNVSVIRTPYIEKVGTKVGLLGRMLLKNQKTKHWMRTLYALQSLWLLKNANETGSSYKDYFQAGKSAEGVKLIEPAGDVVRRFGKAWEAL